MVGSRTVSTPRICKTRKRFSKRWTDFPTPNHITLLGLAVDPPGLWEEQGGRLVGRKCSRAGDASVCAGGLIADAKVQLTALIGIEK